MGYIGDGTSKSGARVGVEISRFMHGAESNQAYISDWGVATPFSKRSRMRWGSGWWCLLSVIHKAHRHWSIECIVHRKIRDCFEIRRLRYHPSIYGAVVKGTPPINAISHMIYATNSTTPPASLIFNSAFRDTYRALTITGVFGRRPFPSTLV